ncbi:hypothetical protein [Lihuaxuella thermophila]|uniref:Short chain dehydrogenase n=1 Tax=Lihuaxuella thermophila TaxID=1173111 RepID=A0A1H8HMB5_9BACL|nr:hypothetical protein [Lihuaxuella thermophila]SEN57254.1 hypothetical protein SAMN05444955_114104 [Lihuaxuella thermophila]
MSQQSDHVLVVGGTGMLQGVVQYFAGVGSTVSVVARNVSKLNMLAEKVRDLSGNIHKVAVDYRDTNKFIDVIHHSVVLHGAISKAVVWIHSTAPDAPYALARLLNASSPRCKYFRVLGSAAAHPEKSFDDRDFFKNNYSNLSYHEIILGFVVEQNRSRWLSREEICTGILNVIHQPLERAIIGTVSPWSLRP